MKSETKYLLRRASEEARMAIAAEQPEAADAHDTLAVCYSAKAVALIEDEEDEANDQRG
jgi:hypothetical protein